MFKFLHTSDIHLDSPLKGIQRYEGAPVEECRNATRKAFENLINLSINERVDFILISGDLYDGDWKDFNTGLFLNKEMARLYEHKIKVFIISGNHDAESQITRHLRLPPNVYRFSTTEPETHIIEGLGVAIHGQGFSNRAVFEDLSQAFPQAIPSLYNIGMLHTSLNGREGHEPYAPCSLTGLLSKGYDYWALGHIHKREVVNQNPLIIFPGNTQGRNIKEEGPKGCTVVTVRDKDSVHPVHHNIDVLRWYLCNLIANDCENIEDILDSLNDKFRLIIRDNPGQRTIVRVNIFGRTNAHKELLNNLERWIAEIRALAIEVSHDSLWVEKVNFNTEMNVDINDIIKSGDPLGELIKFIDAINSLDELMPLIKDDLNQLKKLLPKELFYGDDAINLELNENIEEIIKQVKQLLIARLI